MDVPLWTLDTNVIVSGLLSPDGPPGRLVDAALARQLRFALDDRIVREYRSVLARPKFGFKSADLALFFGILAHQQHLAVAPAEGLSAAEAADTKFLEVAAAIESRVLVTGNTKHYPRSGRGHVRVLTPAEALVELATVLGSPRG